jgi:type I restriction enzyme R subunit
MIQSNFGFLQQYNPPFFQLAVTAEKNLFDDPNTTLVKLRQLGEAFSKYIASTIGISVGQEVQQVDLFRILSNRGYIEKEQLDIFHFLRKAGNEAIHEFTTPKKQAFQAIELARTLAIWFHRSYKDPDFKAGKFIIPESNEASIKQKENLISRLEEELKAFSSKVNSLENLSNQEKSKREEIESTILQSQEEIKIWQALAEENEKALATKIEEYEKEINKLKEESASKSAEEIGQIKSNFRKATSRFELSEKETRIIIDKKLSDAGWLADTDNLRYSKGTRPEKGKNLAIAEWMIGNDRADYVLFAGLTPVGIVEAKKFNEDVVAHLRQAENYSKHYQFQSFEISPFTYAKLNFSSWDYSGKTKVSYKIPFVYSTNGRSFHRQFETKSGVWFRDVRRANNIDSASEGFHTPETLLELLKQDVQKSQTELDNETFEYTKLRDYQVKAVKAVEKSIANGKRVNLLAMATGTGKTKTAVSMIYRFLKTNRFRRVLFLVDRNSLGKQASDVFKEMRLEQNKTFAEIYDVKELSDLKPDIHTKVHVATVQAMVRRIFSPNDKVGVIPIDQYDLILVDEAHRGYVLDQEMTEGELEFRNEEEYVSSYRRVLDYFDAVKIALTATPAKHTTEIFGAPVFEYSYTEAVIDGFLIDHEPPIRFETELSRSKIKFTKGEKITVFNQKGNEKSYEIPDELEFEVDEFNKKVITENFNRVICEALVSHLEFDFANKRKTIVFCVDNTHADLVVQILKEEFQKKLGEIDNRMIEKITGKANNPEELLRLFKLESFPNIAVTVDYLSTGVDIEEVCNIVFLRRIKSRILFEQMIGRATRPCEEIEKEYFRIFDGVDIYSTLEAVNTMKPVVQSVNVSIQTLLEEFLNEKSQEIKIEKDKSHADIVINDFKARINRLFKKAEGLKDKSEVASALMSLESETKLSSTEILNKIKNQSTTENVQFLKSIPTLPVLLENLSKTITDNFEIHKFVSTHPDRLVETYYDFPIGKKPEDYLEAFSKYIEENKNKLAAMIVVTKRPRDLTRQSLKELILELDRNKFGEKYIQAAWKSLKNEDIAANIVGYIRQMALGSPLVPFDERVDRALKKIIQSKQWTDSQKQWLNRLAKQIKKEIIVDEESLEDGAFKDNGGKKQLDKIFDGQIIRILGDFQEEIWEEAG